MATISIAYTTTQADGSYTTVTATKPLALTTAEAFGQTVGDLAANQSTWDPGTGTEGCSFLELYDADAQPYRIRVAKVQFAGLGPSATNLRYLTATATIEAY